MCLMTLIKVDTSNELADIFTKPLQLPQFLSCREDILQGKRGWSFLRRDLMTPEGVSCLHQHKGVFGV